MTKRRDLRRALEDLGQRPVPVRSQAFVDDLEAKLLDEGAHRMPARALSTSRTDLRRTLEHAGTRGAPAPTPAFVADLERRLLELAGSDQPTAGGAAGSDQVVSLESRRRARLAPVASIAAAVVAGLLLVGALSGWLDGGGGSSPRLELTSAVDTTVQLPDGRVVAGRPGLALPDGSIVQTGPHGHAAAGAFRIGPGLSATVDGNHLELSSAPRDSSSGTGTEGATEPSGTPPAGDAGTTGGSPGAPPDNGSTGGSSPSSSPPPSVPDAVPPLPPVTIPTVTLPPVTVPPLPKVTLPGLFGSGG